MMLILTCTVLLSAAGKEPVKLFLEPSGQPGKLHPLVLKDEQLHPLDGFFYNENYFLIAITNEGYYGYVNLLVTNTGVKSMTPGISFTIVTPDKKRLVRDLDFAPQDLAAPRDRFELRLKNNFLRAVPGGYEIKVSADNLGLELRYQNQVPGFVLGNGRAVFGRTGEDFFYINYPAPRPVVTGKFIVNGKTVPVSGWGYMDHSLFNTNPANFERVWHNMKFHSATHTVLVSSFTTPEKYERGFSIFAVTNQKSILCVGTEVKVTEEGVTKDAASGKPYPRRVRYELIGDRCQVRANVDVSNVTEKFDVLAKLDQKLWGKAAKAAINTFIARPWYFRSVAALQLEITLEGGKITPQGTAFNEIIFTE